VNGKDIINKLKAEGWKLDRINGNHDVGMGLVSTIARQTGVEPK